MKKLYVMFLLFILCTVLLLGCHSNLVGHQIVGVWEHDGNRIEFGTDGYLKKGDQKYAYTVTEEKVTIDNNGEATVVEYSINSNGTMTMNGMIYYPVSKKHK